MDLEAVQAEIPTWPVQQREVGWVAFSPTFHLDGVSVAANDPIELIARVRDVVRVYAIVMGRGGQLLPRFQAVSLETITEVEGIEVDPDDPGAFSANILVTEAKVIDEVQIRVRPASSPIPDLATARMAGFEGDACPECGAMQMVRNGSCLKCMACGSTSGCS